MGIYGDFPYGPFSHICTAFSIANFLVRGKTDLSCSILDPGTFTRCQSPVSLHKCVRAWRRVTAIGSKGLPPLGSVACLLAATRHLAKVTNRKKVWLASQFEEASVTGPWGSWSHCVHHLEARGVNAGGQSTLSFLLGLLSQPTEWGCVELGCVFPPQLA